MRSLYNCRARDSFLSFGKKTWIMGIVNASPDSFSGDGKKTVGSSVAYACKLLEEGADIIDIGGESTRPNASRVSRQEEIDRVIPVIKILAKRIKAPISIDTSKIEVAQAALDAGASIVNNVQALQASKIFLTMVREYKAALVLMHMRGNPRNMQSKTNYDNVVVDVIKELKIGIEKCLEIGIKKDSLIIDPGLGFAKTANQNLALINHLNRFKILKRPLMVGSSRKSFIGKILGNDVDGRLMGTAATVVVAATQGAHIVRVHDVKKLRETLRLTDAILNA